jgi:NAD(P)H dehydrogenase (quinone)
MPGLQQMRRTALGFCGIRPQKTLTFGPIIRLEQTRYDCITYPT